MRTATIYYHGACFDGLVSAALISKRVDEWAPGADRVEFVGVGYGQKDRWRATELLPGSAVVDFLYHPGASVWVDHHEDPFLTPDDRASFEADRSGRLIWEPKAPSCAGVIWRRWGDRGAWPGFLEDAARWADVIDGAKFNSVAETLQCEAPALQIWLAMQAVPMRVDEGRLIHRLARAPIADIAIDGDLRTGYEAAKRLQDEGTRRFNSAWRVEGPIVMFDVDTTGVIVNRYLPFQVRPDAEYSAGLCREPAGIHLLFMRNRWKDEGPVNLGLLAGRFGGGGHHRVGAVQFDASSGAKSDAVLREIATELHRRVRIAA
jgi:hypothetical protein